MLGGRRGVKKADQVPSDDEVKDCVVQLHQYVYAPLSSCPRIGALMLDFFSFRVADGSSSHVASGLLEKAWLDSNKVRNSFSLFPVIDFVSHGVLFDPYGRCTWWTRAPMCTYGLAASCPRGTAPLLCRAVRTTSRPTIVRTGALQCVGVRFGFSQNGLDRLMV